MAGEGLRFNEGRVRVDLLPPFSINEMARVLTKGSLKYAPRNWEKGMSWTTVLASLKRHLSDWELGMDVDPDDGQLLMAKVMTNAAFITEYYKIYPQGDDRPHKYLSYPKIGLDIDDVLADFIPAFAAANNLAIPTSWSWCYEKDAAFKEFIGEEFEMNEFYSNLKTLIDPTTLPFEPTAYITSRPCKSLVTESWLSNNGFPASPVITVGMGQSKVEAIKAAGIEVFVDDRFDTFVELNNAGICCYLFDSCHNQRYDVGEKRIKSLLDLPWFKK